MVAGSTHKSTHKIKKISGWRINELVLHLTSDLFYSKKKIKKMTSNLSAGQFQQEAGTAGPAPLSSDDLTERKTDWINAGIMWPCDVGL